MTPATTPVIVSCAELLRYPAWSSRSQQGLQEEAFLRVDVTGASRGRMLKKAGSNLSMSSRNPPHRL